MELTLFPKTIDDWLIVIITTSAFVFLWIGIAKKRDIKCLSLFTNFMWTILDVLIYVILIEERSSCLMLGLGCAFGSFLTSLFLIKYDKKKKWGKNETYTLIVVLMVVCLWLYSGSNILGLTLAVVAEIVAGWPQMEKSWIKPGSRYVLVSYVLFLIVYIFSVFSAPNWELENIFFPSAFSIYCILDTLPLIIKWQKIIKRYNRMKKRG